MNAILSLILIILSVYLWIVIARAVLSWLVHFGVVNTRNAIVASIGQVLFQLTEPVLAPIRRILPNLGGVDLSPVIVILVIYFLRMLIIQDIWPALM